MGTNMLSSISWLLRVLGVAAAGSRQWCSCEDARALLLWQLHAQVMVLLLVVVVTGQGGCSRPAAGQGALVVAAAAAEPGRGGGGGAAAHVGRRRMAAAPSLLCHTPVDRFASHIYLAKNVE